MWKTIQLGSVKTVNGLRRLIIQAGMHIGDEGGNILSKPAFHVSAEKKEVDLVVVSIANLGFENTHGLTLADIYKRAKELGLDLCSNEVGPQLRLQYTDQPHNQYLIVAMEPINCDRYRTTDPHLFVVGRGDLSVAGGDDGRSRLDAENAEYAIKYCGVFVFVKPRK